MIKCLLCNKETERPMYCSKQCVKKSWYLRNSPDVASYATGNPDFWKTETGIGFRWEIEGAKLLGAKHLEFNKSDADLNWNGKKVDVKSCNLYKRKLQHGKEVGNVKGWWVFNRNKLKPIDFFLCFCIKDDKPVKILLIPSEEFPLKGTTVGQTSRFDKYNIL